MWKNGDYKINCLELMYSFNSSSEHFKTCLYMRLLQSVSSAISEATITLVGRMKSIGGMDFRLNAMRTSSSNVLNSLLFLENSLISGIVI